MDQTWFTAESIVIPELKVAPPLPEAVVMPVPEAAARVSVPVPLIKNIVVGEALPNVMLFAVYGRLLNPTPVFVVVLKIRSAFVPGTLPPQLAPTLKTLPLKPPTHVD
ncbi:MAG TPA: hypothetical protein VG936_18500 [Lacunisphaera sp.]|nr:hypothetical protein [Lacunisphaera sp.]